MLRQNYVLKQTNINAPQPNGKHWRKAVAAHHFPGAAFRASTAATPGRTAPGADSLAGSNKLKIAVKMFHNPQGGLPLPSLHFLAIVCHPRTWENMAYAMVWLCHSSPPAGKRCCACMHLLLPSKSSNLFERSACCPRLAAMCGAEPA